MATSEPIDYASSACWGPRRTGRLNSVLARTHSRSAPGVHATVNISGTNALEAHIKE